MLTSGILQPYVGDDLGVGFSTLSKWMRAHRDTDVASAEDLGSQYCSHDHQIILSEHGFLSSMTGKGNCYDNAAVDTFFKTIKAELVSRRIWETHCQAKTTIVQYINGFHNPRRRYSGF